MKRILALILSFVMIFCLAACGGANNSNDVAVEETQAVKIGLICLHDNNSSYDLNFITAFKEACEATGVEYLIKTNIDESAAAYDAACELADNGCNIVFADSFGHEDYIIQAAQDFPDVEFCHATGTQAHTIGLSNFHNAFASIYEGRYLDGIALGMKLNDMIANKEITKDEAIVGYVGAYQYAEVISGYTSFYLGVRSVCPSAKMKVTFTDSWYDETAEKEAANSLINKGCVAISGHADSMGAPTLCETQKVPFVFYNGDLSAVTPNSFIVSTRINWAPYFEYIINCVRDGKAIDVDWTGTIATGSVEMTAVNEAVAAPGTAEVIADAIELFKNGEIHVFDCGVFTVDGKSIDSYMADVDTDDTFAPDTEVIFDGYFHESEFRSAPYFDIAIDGIEILGN